MLRMAAQLSQDPMIALQGRMAAGPAQIGKPAWPRAKTRECHGTRPWMSIWLTYLSTWPMNSQSGPKRLMEAKEAHGVQVVKAK